MSPNIFDQEVLKHLPNFNMFRADRAARNEDEEPRQGGGTAILVSRDIPANVIARFDDGSNSFVL